MSADPSAVARSYLAAFATGDPAAVAAHVTDDFVNEHTSELGSSCAGRDEYLRRLPGFLGDFADLTYEVEHMVADASQAFVAYMMRATYGGAPIEIRGAMRLEVRDGLIAHRTEYFDSATFATQAGL